MHWTTPCCFFSSLRFVPPCFDPCREGCCLQASPPVSVSRFGNHLFLTAVPDADRCSLSDSKINDLRCSGSDAAIQLSVMYYMGPGVAGGVWSS